MLKHQFSKALRALGFGGAVFAASLMASQASALECEHSISND